MKVLRNIERRSIALLREPFDVRATRQRCSHFRIVVVRFMSRHLIHQNTVKQPRATLQLTVELTRPLPFASALMLLASFVLHCERNVPGSCAPPLVQSCTSGDQKSGSDSTSALSMSCSTFSAADWLELIGAAELDAGGSHLLFTGHSAIDASDASARRAWSGC